MRFMMKELNRFEGTRRHRGCHVARRRHPFRQATFIVTVATLAYVAAVAIMGLAAETVLLHLTQLSQPTPLAPMPTCVPRASPSADVSAAARRSSAARALLAAFALPLHRCRLVISVYGHLGLPSLFSLSWGQLQAAVSGL